jgi:hypothetical protein
MSSEDAQPAFHVLALSGGGFRGLYTATVLKHLEEDFGGPIARRFDLICGTSAGGLLAMGVAAEIPAAELQAMFEQSGERIFGSSSLLKQALRWLRMWFTAKHSSGGLRDVLTERFGERTIGDLRHRLLVPSVNYSTGRGHFFKTPHAEAFRRDHKRRLVDVGLATAAAPTYFPLHRIDGEGVFADGGLVANSPGLLGLHEAEHVLGVMPTTVRVLAIGTMTLGATVPGSASLKRGILGWGAKVFDLVISAQEYAVHAMLGHKLQSNYYRIDDDATPQQSKDIASLDLVSAGAVNVLKERGSQAAKRVVGDPAFRVFMSHKAASPTFFHGPSKNSES